MKWAGGRRKGRRIDWTLTRLLWLNLRLKRPIIAKPHSHNTTTTDTARPENPVNSGHIHTCMDTLSHNTSYKGHKYNICTYIAGKGVPHKPPCHIIFLWHTYPHTTLLAVMHPVWTIPPQNHHSPHIIRQHSDSVYMPLHGHRQLQTTSNNNAWP